MTVDGGRARPALGDGPHNQRLPATGVTADEDPWLGGLPVGGPGDVAARIELDPQVGQQRALLRAGEAHREKHQVSRYLALGAGNLLELAVLHLDLDELERSYPVLPHEASGGDGE